MGKRLFILFFFCLGLYGCATFDYTKMREDYIATHPNINEQTKSDIRNGYIRAGMTKEEVLASWGQEAYPLEYAPSQKTCSAFGCQEFYNGYTYSFYFSNGKLISWSENNY